MDLEAAIIASRFITLRWSPPQTSKEPILGYSIFYKQENSERERVLNSTKGNLEEVNVQGLSPGASYLFRVVALNQHGAGTTSSTLRVSTQPDLDVPGPVSGLEAKATTSFSILVSWSPPLQSRGFITKYKLYYRQVCIAFSRVMSLGNFYVNFEAIDIDRVSLKRKKCVLVVKVHYFQKLSREPTKTK